jgi:mRNA interferase MazF
MPMRYAFDALVILAFPFIDAVRKKRRLAPVLHDLGDGDLILARVTTQQAHSRCDAKIDDWRNPGLLAPSTVRLPKIATSEGGS